MGLRLKTKCLSEEVNKREYEHFLNELLAEQRYLHVSLLCWENTGKFSNGEQTRIIKQLWFKM